MDELKTKNKGMLNIKEDYFEEIDTPKKAYFLGLIYADGNISIRQKKRYKNTFEYRFNLTLKKDDSYILTELAKEFGESCKLCEEKNTIKNKTYFYSSLNIYRKKTCEDLISHGVFPRKTFILTWPSDLKKELLNHFVRGYFDGDGGINKFQNGKNLIFSSSVVGNLKFITSLSYFLTQELGITPHSIYKPKKYQNTDISISTFSISKKTDLKKFLDYIYQNSDSLRLDRKYNIYKLFIEHYKDNWNKRYSNGRITKINPDRMIKISEDYKMGHTIQEIKKKYRCSENTINVALNIHKLSKRSFIIRKRKIDLNKYKQIVKDRSLGLTISDLKKKYSCSYKTIKEAINYGEI